MFKGFIISWGKWVLGGITQ